MKSLQEMSSKELKVLGKEKHIKNWWSLSKAALIEAIEVADPQKRQFKDKCDGCGKMAVLQSVDGKLLCDDCIEKLVSDEEPKEEVKENLVPMPGIEKLAELKEEYSHKEVKEEIVEEQVSQIQDKKPEGKRKQLEYKGKSQTICAWARELGVSANTLYNRIYYKHMTVEEAFEMPIKKGSKK